jgi:hypothetical protein
MLAETCIDIKIDGVEYPAGFIVNVKDDAFAMTLLTQGYIRKLNIRDTYVAIKRITGDERDIRIIKQKLEAYGL